ncbi:MAG: hypothetical protein ABFD61_01665 [Chloroherpetonaceae bacterium]
MDIIEVYNGELGVKLSDNHFEITKFESNGYLGIAFKTMIFTEYKKTEEITFEISAEGEEPEIVNKSVFLFRPEVKLQHFPSLITLESNNKKLTKITDGIHLNNIGDGMAVIGMKPYDNSQIQLHEPENIYKFLKSIWEDLIGSLENLKQKFPEYDDAFSEYIDFGNYIVTHLDEILDMEMMTRHKKLNDTFENIFLSNMELTEQYIECVSTAYLKNYHLITNIENFVNYLKSIENNKILIVNPLLVLRATKTLKRFEGEILIFDLNGHKYPPIPLSFEVNCDDDCEIPMHQIFVIKNGA